MQVSEEVKRTFTVFLNNAFRLHRFLDPAYKDTTYTGEHIERPFDFDIYIIQRIVQTESFTKQTLFEFIKWYEKEKERNTEDIIGWEIYGSHSGGIITEFGKVTFQVNNSCDNILIEIKLL